MGADSMVGVPLLSVYESTRTCRCLADETGCSSLGMSHGHPIQLFWFPILKPLLYSLGLLANLEIGAGV